MRRPRKPIDESERVIQDRERSRERTMNRAVRLLAARPRSVAELRLRLLEKPWTDEQIVDAVIEKLKSYKYLDDEQYARDLAASKLRARPQGKRRLLAAMMRKPLGRSLIEDAVTEAYEKVPEIELLDQVIAKRIRLKGPPRSREERKKFLDHLLRQGFGYDLIRDRLPTISKDEDPGSLQDI